MAKASQRTGTPGFQMPWWSRMRWWRRVSRTLHSTVGRMLRHDGLNVAQAAAYSAILALFPAIVVLAATLRLLPDVSMFKIEASTFFDQVLPSTVLPLLDSYFLTSGADVPSHTARTLLLAAIAALLGGSGTIATLMEGLHRAGSVPEGCWTFWKKRGRALLLVPLSLLPLLLASILVVFGRLITEWMAGHLALAVRPVFFMLTIAARWTISLGGVVGLSAMIYHLGVPSRCGTEVYRTWRQTLPGAFLATTMWFVLTLLFGWYVTRVANYSAVYGSLGAGIALLIWLDLVFLSVLCGAEFNYAWRVAPDA